MELHTIPRTTVDLTLRVVRLPLLALERIAGHQGDDIWAPGIAFDAFEAGVRQTVGSITRDADLVHRGRLEQARVEELREIVRLQVVADETRAEADQSFEERRDAAERKRREAAQRAEQRESDAERRRREASAEAEEKADKRIEEASKKEQAAKKAIASKARTAKKASVTKQRKAVGTAKRATNAKASSLKADDKIRATKAARRTA